MVSAFAARQRLVFGQVKVADKSNEIIAIPALLDMLAIEGAVVTIDAMGCQRNISQKVLDKKADYILALKGNQGTLREDRPQGHQDLSTPTTAGSRPKPIRSSTMSLGCRIAMSGRD
jgi:hypothetical protein